MNKIAILTLLGIALANAVQTSHKNKVQQLAESLSRIEVDQALTITCSYTINRLKLDPTDYKAVI